MNRKQKGRDELKKEKARVKERMRVRRKERKI